MARTTNEIQESIKAEFMANTTLIEAYSLDSTKTFDSQFLKVSLESMLIYIISIAIHLFEKAIDQNKKEIEDIIACQKLHSFNYYQDAALHYQHGSALQYNDETCSFDYPEIDESAKIIKYCSVRQVTEDSLTKLKILVSKEDGESLTEEEIDSFEKYIQFVGSAGIHYSIDSIAPTLIGFTLTIYRDPLLLNADGTLIETSENVVQTAIKQYLNSLDYAGKFNRTRFVQALCNVEGVTDVILNAVKTGDDGTTVTDQNIEADGGMFTFNEDLTTINYLI